MTPAEKIQAAIDKLEALKATRLVLNETYLTHRVAAAELIVTLHRTIDAQLELLRTSIPYIESWIKGDLDLGHHMLALASAILGEDS